jgi:hypothetical protein
MNEPSRNVSPEVPSVPLAGKKRPAAWIWVVAGLLILCLCCLLIAAGIYLLRDRVPAIGNVLYTATPTATLTPTATPTPRPTPTPTPDPAANCNPNAIYLGANDRVTGYISAGDTFFETIAMYCLVVPAGGRELVIGINGFSIDFDIYVSVSYEELMSPSGFGEYYSRSGGAGTPEQVTIPNPGSIYYIQVVSYYFNTSGSFTVWNQFSP